MYISYSGINVNSALNNIKNEGTALINEKLITASQGE
jgi:ribose 5-phosphate isomerase